MPAAEFELGETIQSRYSYSEAWSPMRIVRRTSLRVAGSNIRTVW